MQGLPSITMQRQKDGDNNMSYRKYARKLVLVEEKDNTFLSSKITTSADVNKYIRQFYGDDINIYESSFLLCLNRANMVNSWVKISQGGLTGTVVDIRIVLKYAIESLSTSIVLVHNHPSGNLEPSKADKEITDKIVNAAKYMDIQLIDHLIICDDNKYFSFADEGLI